MTRPPLATRGMAKHYDVAVLGAGIGALAAAALLARRSWRVLVLGHGQRPATYAYDGVTLARRTFTFLAAPSPAWNRIVIELAQSQTFRRRLAPVDPMLQAIGPDFRLDLPVDPAAFAHEVERELAAVKRVVDDATAEIARTTALADAAFDKDVVWPPGTFWERRETGRAAAALPLADTGGGPLAELPRGHTYRAIVEATARFASDACVLPPFAVARLHGAWTRGLQRLARDEEELGEFLLERVRAHGGEARMTDRATSVVHRAGRVTGVVVDGDDATTGVQFVVSDSPMQTVLDLATDFVPSRRALAALPRLAAGEHRFVVSMVVRDAGVPELLGSEAFLLPRDGGRPAVHLQKRASTMAGATLLVAEALLPAGGHPKPSVAREAILRTVEQFLPFVERHYLIVDSVHDGRPLWDYRSGARREIERARFRATGASIDPEPMLARYNVDDPGPRALGGLAGEPIRTPLAGAYLAGRTSLPALGQEGELLAAWSAARLVTRTDRRKEKMRREMWSKVELG